MSEERPINRRSFLSRVAGGAVVGGVAIGLVTGGAANAITDNDPNDPVGYGRGWRRRRYYCTDRDPYDPVGRGRRCYYRPRRRCTDRDPYDPVGRGRWCRRY
jgi:hypothetical protein